MRKAILLVVVAVTLQAVAPSLTEARVVRLVVEQTRTFAEGDPSDPLNAIIVNFDKAPRNARGMVEFTAPFFILKPVDMARGNQKIFYGVNNRGNKLDLAWRTILPGTGPNNNNPLTAADVADGLLFRLGYTYVDAGWQGSVAPGNDRLDPNFPRGHGDERAANRSPIRVEYADAEGFTRPLEHGKGTSSHRVVSAGGY